MRRRLRLLLSTGPTREPLDPVRFISNYSTGYLGAQLAREAVARGHRVTVVSGPVSEPLPRRARVIPVERAAEMAQALRREAPRADAVIMAAAVCDFRPRRMAPRKLSRRSRLVLRLEATPDLIAGLPRRAGQVRVGFALETGRVLERARRKLRRKRLDLLLAQHASATHRPFGRGSVEAWILDADGRVTRLGRVSKRVVARALLDRTETLWHSRRRQQRLVQ